MMHWKKGFTLIELLVVISIIAVLLSILMPALQKVKEKTRLLICLSNVRQVTIACVAYATANDGFYPLNPVSGAGASPNYFNGVNLGAGPGNNLALDLEPYLQTLGVFKDPSIPHAEPVANWDMANESVWPWWYLGGDFKTSYDLNVKNAKMESRAGVPLFSDHCMNLEPFGGIYGDIRTNHIVRNGSRYPDAFFGHLAYGYSYHCWNVPFADAGDLEDLKYVKRLNAGYNDGSSRLIPPEKMVKIWEWFPEGVELP